MSSIPAASVYGVEVDRIRETDPIAATEIERIGRLLLTGEETEEDMLLVCRLLYEHAEKGIAELLLVANATEGDELHSLHQRLFGGVNDEYERAVRNFSDQIGVTLDRVRSPRLYSYVYTCSKPSLGHLAILPLSNFSTWPLETQITYEPGTGILADLYSASESSDQSFHPLSLRYHNGSWRKDDT